MYNNTIMLRVGIRPGLDGPGFCSTLFHPVLYAVGLVEELVRQLEVRYNGSAGHDR